MSYQGTMALLGLLLSGCWPALEPVDEEPAEGCELQYDCRDSSADQALCVAGLCQPSGTISCSADDDCGALGWCLLIAEDCVHGDPESCDGGTEGVCMPSDPRHCRNGDELLDCYAEKRVCCESITGPDTGSRRCAAAEDCTPELGGYPTINSKELQ
ncbi:MAG: hypothetical protein JRD89_03550 [Deltaproteobacteria bacterium]|nr:hypothetical protein [Deltaproteobacteria bacterium]